MSEINLKLKTYDELTFEISRLNTDKYLLKEENKRLNNIIKEVREYIEKAQERDEDKESCSLYIPKLLKILDKGE